MKFAVWTHLYILWSFLHNIHETFKVAYPLSDGNSIYDHGTKHWPLPAQIKHRARDIEFKIAILPFSSLCGTWSFSPAPNAYPSTCDSLNPSGLSCTCKTIAGWVRSRVRLIFEKSLNPKVCVLFSFFYRIQRGTNSFEPKILNLRDGVSAFPRRVIRVRVYKVKPC